MVGLVVLAGGQSRRMGQDKARMAGGIRRILTEAKSGPDPRVVLAGPQPRGEELEREGWTADADVVLDDPAHATCLHDVLVHVFNGDLPSVVLAPCDAVSIDRVGFAELAAMPEGVPWIHPAVAKCSSAAFRKGGWPRPMPSDGSRPCSMNSKTSTSNLPQAT